MLEEVGVPYDTKVLDYGTHMATGAYLSVNPMGKVPALVHGEQVVTETAAICAYLADAFPEANLAPPHGRRGAYYRWLFFGAGPLEASVTMQAMGWAAPDSKMQKVVGFGTKERVADTLDQALSSTPYIAGHDFTAADVYLGSLVVWNLGFNLLESRPALVEYAARLTEREAYQRASALDDAAKPNWVA